MKLVFKARDKLQYCIVFQFLPANCFVWSTVLSFPAPPSVYWRVAHVWWLILDLIH